MIEVTRGKAIVLSSPCLLARAFNEFPRYVKIFLKTLFRL